MRSSISFGITDWIFTSSHSQLNVLLVRVDHTDRHYTLLRVHVINLGAPHHVPKF